MKPYPLQEVGIEFLSKRFGALLADKTGVGKTLEAVEAAKRTTSGPVLIVSRQLNRLYWAQVIREQDPGVDIEFCGPAGVHDEETVRSWFKPPRRAYLIIHHDAIRYIYHKLQRYGMWGIVICDEAHRIRSRKTQMTRGLKAIPSFRRWALTATPMDKHPGEFWSILNWLNSGVFKSYWEWYNTFVKINPQTGRPIGVKQPEMLARTIAPYYLARTKKDVRADMPDPVYENVPLEMTPTQAEAYKRLKRESLVAFEGTEPDYTNTIFISSVLARIVYLRKMAADPVSFGVQDDGAKLLWFLEWFEDYANEPKVIFTHSKELSYTLAQVTNGVLVNGDVSKVRRDLAVQKFQEGEANTIVGTIDTMGESVNLQRAGIAIFMEQHWSSIAMEQAVGRVWRIDIEQAPTIITPYCMGTVDELIRDVLQKKQDDRTLVERFLKKEMNE